MNIPVRAAVLFSAVLCCTAPLTGQWDTSARPPADTVRTGDDLGGIHYFLKIVDSDTLTKDNMPIVGFAGFTLASSQPVPKKQVAPVYPDSARDLGLAGIVWLKCRIGADGLVKETKVMKADAVIFVSPAVNAAKQWMFTPALLNGKPIEVWAAIPFRFGPGG